MELLYWISANPEQAGLMWFALVAGVAYIIAETRRK